jgi:O-antigen/teichoic acid export membrane protein
MRISLSGTCFTVSLGLSCRLAGNVAVFVVIARLPGITPQEFGQITYAVALAALFVLLAQFGLPTLIIREVAANKDHLKSLSRSAFTLRLLLSLVAFALLLAYLCLIGMEGQAATICIVMALALFIGALSVDLQAIFQSQEKMHFELIGVVIENVLLFGLAVLSFLFHPNAVQVAAIFLIAKTAAFVVNYVMCARHLLVMTPAWDKKDAQKLLAGSAPFAIASVLAAGVTQIDTVLLRELIEIEPEAAVGLYQAAIRLFLIPMLLPEIIMKVFLPMLARLHGSTGVGLVADLAKINNLLLTTGLLIGLLVLFRGGDLVLVIYGDEYGQAGLLLQLLGLTIMMRFGAAYNLYFTIRDRVWFRVACAALALAALVVLDFLLIPRFGAIGAVYASILAHIVYWVPYLLAMKRAEGAALLGWKWQYALPIALLFGAYLSFTAQISVAVYLLPFDVLLGFLCVLITLPRELRDRIIGSRLRLLP